MSIKTVFLSSTGRDLALHRQEVYDTIEGMEGFHCVRMENFGAHDWESDNFCRAKVAECNLLVGIVGHLYGGCPEESEQSFTVREYETAIATELPRLMFIAPEDFPLPANLFESDDKRNKQRAFRERVSRERLRDTFTSPENLARRVIQAIRNWEQEQAATEQSPTTAEAKGVMPLPPQPNFVHPYPLQEHFTGRLRERQMLTEWLASGQESILALIAIGGMGKSALTWAWLQRDVLGFPLPGLPEDPADVAETSRVLEANRPDGVLWWSFYEREASFSAFLDEALTYASGGSVKPEEIQSAHEKIRALLTVMQQHRILLVLDGFERELRAYAGINAAYQGDAVAEEGGEGFRGCTDPHAADFLRQVSAIPLKGRVLLTSRLFPLELEDLAGCKREDLKEFDPEDAVAFFEAQGIRGNRPEIQDACAPYGYLPLALCLLAGLIVRDKEMPRDIKVAGKYPVLPELKGKEQHHILQVAYDALDRRKQALLSRISAFRSPMDYDALIIFNTFKGKKKFDAVLDELIDRGLLLFDAEQGRYDLHPIVRQYAYDRLADKEGTHTRLRDYFSDVPTPEEEKIQSVEDLAPIIELYHHTVRAGRYDEACDLFRDRLAMPLYFRLGAYQTCIELLRALFPDGEDRPPRLKNEDAQAWTLTALADSYSLSGQPRRAVPLVEQQNSIREKQGDKRNLAIGLGNLADDQLKLGELAAAEGNLQRCIELSGESGNSFGEAVGHQDLGRLLAYKGAFDEAARELDAALASFSKLGATQSECIVWASRALRALLMGDPEAALQTARRALEFWEKVAEEHYPVESDRIRVEWLLGAALVALTPDETSEEGKNLTQAETHLTESLTRCRRINLVEFEPDILRTWARWHRAKGNAQEASKHAQEALAITDRCEYRLVQADIHNFLARLSLDAGDRDAARNHAETARERALCDGPPHFYKPALDEADRLLKEIEKPS